MRIPFFNMFVTSPFEGLQEHAEKVQECTWAFQQAIECHVSKKCQTFEEFRAQVIQLESEADAIKRRIRGHLPKGTLLPVDKFQLFRYLREQDSVLDAVEDALDWLSYRSDPGIPPELEKDFFLLVEAVIDPIEELTVEGLIQTQGGIIAFVQGRDNISYIIRPGTKLYNGEVKEIQSTTVVFRQQVNDPKQLKPYIDVVRELVD